MQLAREVERLRLDVLAVRCCAALREGQIPHVLLKGPSTALWLYDPPRPYFDVDLMVPFSQVGAAAERLREAGLATAHSGRIGELAPHSYLLHSREGFEVDLHVSLPLVTPPGDHVWDQVALHLEPMTLDVGTIPVLDRVGRCLVLALHALSSPATAQPAHDLKLALDVCGPEIWADTRALADRLDALDLVEAAVARITGTDAVTSPRARLYLNNAPGAALGLLRLREARWQDRPLLIWRELVPSREFMVHDSMRRSLGPFALIWAHLRRWRRLTEELRTLWRTRRSSK